MLPPFNTAIVNGYNALFNENRKLGSWSEYLAMREVILTVNHEHRSELSTDLGAIAGLLFEIGSRNLLVGESAHRLTEDERAKLLRQYDKRHKEVLSEKGEEDLHTEMQYHLLKVGKALGYDVISAANDRGKCHGDQRFSFLSLPKFPVLNVEKDTLNTIQLIDVVWFERGSNRVVCAFEVEKSTSIYSGILRLSDLALSFSEKPATLFLIIPDQREKDALLQLNRPALRNSSVKVNYILFSDLRQHCDALCKFGDSHRILEKIARQAGKT